MLRVALGRARLEAGWSVNGSRGVGGLKVSALEFASNPTSPEAASADEGPRGRMMTYDGSEMQNMNLSLQLKAASRDPEENIRDSSCSSLNEVNTD
jgi:hypothetical protein